MVTSSFVSMRISSVIVPSAPRTSWLYGSSPRPRTFPVDPEDVVGVVLLAEDNLFPVVGVVNLLEQQGQRSRRPVQMCGDLLIELNRADRRDAVVDRDPELVEQVVQRLLGFQPGRCAGLVQVAAREDAHGDDVDR